MSDADLLTRYQEALTLFAERVHAITPEQWGAPTPCSEWSVRDLVNHLAVEQMWVPPLVSDGASIGDLGNALEGDRLGDDPVATWDNAMMHALAAFNTPGAFERTVELSYGPTHARDNARVTALVPTLDQGCSPPVRR